VRKTGVGGEERSAFVTGGIGWLFGMGERKNLACIEAMV